MLGQCMKKSIAVKNKKKEKKIINLYISIYIYFMMCISSSPAIRPLLYGIESWATNRNDKETLSV